MLYPGDYWWERWHQMFGVEVPEELRVNRSSRATPLYKGRKNRERYFDRRNKFTSKGELDESRPE